MGKFRAWVAAQGGSPELSRKLGVTRHSINAWLRREACPTTRVAVKLVRMGKGVFTFDDIVKDTFRSRGVK